MDKADIEQLVHSIQSRSSELDALANQLRTNAIGSAFDKWNHDCWCISVAGDALVKLRLFTEQNFRIVESMGVVAVGRYGFELAVWLRLFALDRRYGLVYFDQLLDTQQRYYRDTLAQLQREVDWLKSLAHQENDSHARILRERTSSANHEDAEQIMTEITRISTNIDAEAARRFSLYALDAMTNGYGFQAHLVEKKALPPVREALAAIDEERREFEARVAAAISDIRPARWQWRDMARRVDRLEEYDYLYSFASKLLHATPASITTDQKSLEVPEIKLFLRYIDITIRDILLLASEYRAEIPRE